MKKIVLIDGTNLMFRSFYATAYTGNLMKNSLGEATNALYGYVNMLNKIIEEEKPEYMAVAFDVGKSFRHEEYKDYKAGRKETPPELKEQLPKARELTEKMGIKFITKEGYEADDIIGTFCKRADLDPEWDALLITSDHDYLQLLTNVVSIKLLKQKGYIKYDPVSFKKEYGIDPINIIDLKALMGDASDNIPGVPGVGEKTALKLLQEYQTIDNLYDHIDEIKGKLKEKLIENKDLAYFSYKLATIEKDVPLEEEFADLKYVGPTNELDDFYKRLEFFSLLKKHERVKEIVIDNNYIELDNIRDIKKDGPISYYIECSDENYHDGYSLGMGLFDGENSYYVESTRIKEVLNYIKDVPTFTFDYKKNLVLTDIIDINTVFDLNLALYLLNKKTMDDIAIVSRLDDIEIPEYKDIIKNKLDIKGIVTLKAKYIYDKHDEIIDDLKAEEMYDLFENTELPLSKVLAKMEINGIICDSTILKNMSDELVKEINNLTNEIYEIVGHEFNISSPKQLGEVLFEELKLTHAKKTKTGGYSTGEEILEKIKDEHDVIPKILEYRKLTKLNSTYLEGLLKYIKADGKIHTIYKQTLTRTGRLSSIDPNLQNIPTRDDLGKMIRKAFLPENQVFLSCDYSQIELRILAHISKSKELIDTFIKDEDIHTKVASDIFEKDSKDITPNERRQAKAVIFGIVYGISGFGLGENIGISPKEAKEFINKYFKLYPGVKEYLDLTVKSAYSSGSVRTLFNRKRNIDELFSSNFMVRQSGERMAMNTPIQGTAADILKMAMVEIDKAFVNNNIKSKMLLQIHDELIFDVLESEADKVQDLVTTIMESIVKLDVPLKVSHDFGKNLYETK